MRQIIILLIKAYQLTLSPFFGSHCRFAPSCSRYAMQAVERHGAWRGVYLAVLRIARCHPFNDGGFDPVPARENICARAGDAAQTSADEMKIKPAV